MRVTDGLLGDGEATSIIEERTVTVVAPNVGPTASFTVSPNPANAGQIVTFDGSGSSDPDGTIASADHDWDLDGDGEYDDANGTVVQRSYPSGGARVIGLRVTDADDATDTAPTQTLVVRNAAPTASFTIEPNPAGVGQTVTFDGSASSDPEGPISSPNHDWDLNGDGTLESTGRVVSRSYPAGACDPHHASGDRFQRRHRHDDANADRQRRGPDGLVHRIPQSREDRRDGDPQRVRFVRP